MKNNQIRTGLVVFAVVVLFSNVVFAANEKNLHLKMFILNHSGKIIISYGEPL